jgi:hypothetical protein
MKMDIQIEAIAEALDEGHGPTTDLPLRGRKACMAAQRSEYRLHKNVQDIPDPARIKLMNPDRSRIELYDIPVDPSEADHLADRYPDVVERLSKQAPEWQATLPPGPLDAGVGKNSYPWPKWPRSKMLCSIVFLA